MKLLKVFHHSLSTGIVLLTASDDLKAERRAGIKLARYKSTLSMIILKSLLSIKLKASRINESLLLLVVAFTDSRDSWTTEISNEIAWHIVRESEDVAQRAEFLVDFILKDFIRPLFIKSKPDTITATGRKAMPSSAPPKRFEAATLDRSNKPWKYDTVYAVTVIRWVVETSSVSVSVLACDNFS